MNKIDKTMENAELFSTVKQNGKKTNFVTRFRPAQKTTTMDTAIQTNGNFSKSQKKNLEKLNSSKFHDQLCLIHWLYIYTPCALFFTVHF